MSYFKAKMHQNAKFGWGSRWGSLQRSPRPLDEFKGPTSKGRERTEGDGREGTGGGGRGGEMRRGDGTEREGSVVESKNL